MRNILFWLILLGLLPGCKHREIHVYKDTNILFDWVNLAETDTKSEEMKVHFYTEDADPLCHNANQDGFSGWVPYGNYTVLAFSDNAKNIVYEGLDNYATACVYAQKQQGKASSANNILLAQPSGFYAFRKEVLLKHNATTHTFPLDHHIKYVKITVKLTGEAERVVGGNITLSGIAGGVNIATGQVIDTKDYIVESGDLETFPLGSDFSFFGINETKNTATVELRLSDQTILSTEANLTAALKDLNKPNSAKIEIEIEINIAKNPMGDIVAKLVGWKTGTGSGTVGGK